MLTTKDISGYLGPLAARSDRLTAVSIPGEANTLPAEDTAAAARAAGLSADVADSVPDAVRRVARETPHARILICGSLYLAGHVLRENG
jgi:dihydrofolate synthase/folylpolyglutamate synthase